MLGILHYVFLIYMNSMNSTKIMDSVSRVGSRCLVYIRSWRLSPWTLEEVILIDSSIQQAKSDRICVYASAKQDPPSPIM